MGKNFLYQSCSPHQTGHFLSQKFSSNSLLSCCSGTRRTTFGPWSGWSGRWPKCFFIKVVSLIKPDIFCLKRFPLAHSGHAVRALRGHLLVLGAVGVVKIQKKNHEFPCAIVWVAYIPSFVQIGPTVWKSAQENCFFTQDPLAKTHPVQDLRFAL